MASHNTRRRSRCEVCDRLYHPTDEHPVGGLCPRCFALFLRLDVLYRPDGYEAIIERARAIVEDPAGEDAARLIAIERLMKAMDAMTPEQFAQFKIYASGEIAKYKRSQIQLVATQH